MTSHFFNKRKPVQHNGGGNEIPFFYDNSEFDQFFRDPLSDENLVYDNGVEAPQVENPQSFEWFADEDNFEGQLSVDVFDTEDKIILKAAMAGVNPEDLDIFLDNDMLTIRGRRESGVTVKEDDYYYQECYWGGFSRSVLMPVDVNAAEIKASLKNGVLTVELPKIEKKKKIDVDVQDD